MGMGRCNMGYVSMFRHFWHGETLKKCTDRDKTPLIHSIVFLEGGAYQGRTRLTKACRCVETYAVRTTGTNFFKWFGEGCVQTTSTNKGEVGYWVHPNFVYVVCTLYTLTDPYINFTLI